MNRKNKAKIIMNLATLLFLSAVFTACPILEDLIGGGNLPPIADAGSDRVVEVGTEVLLNGSDSIDPENGVLTYQWQFEYKPTASSAVITNSTSSIAAFIPDVAGEYYMKLTVSDGENLSTSTVTITVTSQQLESIAVTPANSTIAMATTQQFVATGTYVDSSTQDLTAEVSWESSASGTATISNAAGSEGLATAVAPGATEITATLGEVSGFTQLNISDAELVSLEITPLNPSIAMGTVQQFTAIGTYNDSTTQDLTTLVTWESDDTDVAAISNVSGSEGIAVGVSSGTATVTATVGTVSSSTQVNVSAAELVSIDVTPIELSIASGTTQQFTATGNYTDSSTQDLTIQVTWDSTETGVAVISDAVGSKGMATGVGSGTTVISAASGTIIGSTSLDVTGIALVSIAVTPSDISIPDGITQQFTATGTYTDSSTGDLTTQVTWDSSIIGYATISNGVGSEGLATGEGVGTTIITAASGAVSGSTSLEVTAAELTAIAVTPTDPSIANGTTQQFTATGTYTNAGTQDLTTQVTWDSSETGYATISNIPGTEGLATGTGAGTTTITATLGITSNFTLLTVGDPPSVPTALSTGAPTASSLYVSWSAPAGGATSYQVYRDTSAGGAFTELVYDSSGTSFTDTQIGTHQLESIRMIFYRDGTSSTLTLSVYEGEGTLGTLLRSQSIAGGPHSAWITYALSTPVPVNAGARYTYRVQGSLPSPYSGTCLGWADTNPYSGGRGDNGASADYMFQTFVSSVATTYYYKVKATNAFGSSVLTSAVSGATSAASPVVDQSQTGGTKYQPSDPDCWQSFTVLP